MPTKTSSGASTQSDTATKGSGGNGLHGGPPFMGTIPTQSMGAKDTHCTPASTPLARIQISVGLLPWIRTAGGDPGTRDQTRGAAQAGTGTGT
jgi:hypothetical protein